MQTVGIKALKNKLSEYVRLTASGKIVHVTDCNRVVALLVPAQQPSDLMPFEEAGVREGWLTPTRIRDGSATAAQTRSRAVVRRAPGRFGSRRGNRADARRIAWGRGDNAEHFGGRGLLIPNRTALG